MRKEILEAIGAALRAATVNPNDPDAVEIDDIEVNVDEDEIYAMFDGEPVVISVDYA